MVESDIAAQVAMRRGLPRFAATSAAARNCGLRIDREAGSPTGASTRGRRGDDLGETRIGADGIGRGFPRKEQQIFASLDPRLA